MPNHTAAERLAQEIEDTIDQGPIFAAACLQIRESQPGRELLAKEGIFPLDAEWPYEEPGVSIPPDVVYRFIDTLTEEQLRVLRNLADMLNPTTHRVQ
jgi:hypothetical protein